MKKRTSLLLLLLFLLFPLAAPANTVTEGKDGLTWNFHAGTRVTPDGVFYDIYYENDHAQGMITRDEEMDIEPYGQLDGNGLPYVIWSRQMSDGYFYLFLSTFDGVDWSAPMQIPRSVERVNDRECQFRIGLGGKLYITFIRHTDTDDRVMFGVYKSWNGSWAEVAPVVILTGGHTVRQPNLYPIYDDLGLAQLLLSFIHLYPDGEGEPPPDGDSPWETIDQYIRIFNSGDTSPWFQVQ